ncbi:hypothetical protein ACSBR2_028969 [Camellia fascicularis]
MDIDCVGSRLTWTNNRKGWANTMVRLDRALCNTEWQTLFPEGYVHNLPRTYSDHSPLMVFTQDNVHSLALSATDWNRNVFGNIFRKKRWLVGRINGIQSAQAVHYSHNLHSLENQLIEQFNEVFYQEELLWFQKSRSNWITQGERNTKFFHLSTIIRRRKSKIDVLKNNDGVWVDNSTELKALVNEYFKNLFSYTPTIAFSQWNNLSRHLTTEDNLDLHLGNYLRGPLLHSRVNKHQFILILERMQQKLAGWKTGVLSLAGRATLIQSVTNAIPAYTMRTLELPRKVCDEIDKLNCNFLWGDSLERKKVHLVNWQQVCYKKKNGGLGIRRARDQNLALLSKLGWKLLNEEEGLWKYYSGDALAKFAGSLYDKG